MCATHAPGDIVVDPSRLAVACVDGGSEAHALADTLWGSAYRRVSRMVTARHVCWCVRCDVPQQSEHAGRVDRVEL